ASARGLAIAGDVLCVGTSRAPEEGFGPRTERVLVYRREGTAWSEEAELRSMEDFDRFGVSLALDGSTLVVGAPSADVGAGAAHVVERVESTWEPRARLTITDGIRGEGLAERVALSGDIAVLSGPNSYRVFMFRRDGAT